MGENNEDSTVNEEGKMDEKLETKHARQLEVSEIFVVARNCWAHIESTLHEGHNSNVDGSGAVCEGGGNKMDRGVGFNEVIDAEGNMRVDDIVGVEGTAIVEHEVIDDIEVLDGYEDDSNSEGESYKGESGSSDIDESMESDFKVADEEGSDHDDDEMVPYLADGPMEEVRRGEKLVGSTTSPFFMLGMTFENKEELKKALNMYAITHGVKLRVAKSDKKLMKVVCQEGCPFKLYASTYGVQVGFMIKTVLEEHICVRVFKNPRASVKWLSEQFKVKVQETPQFKISEMKNEVERDLKVNVSIHKCKRAKRKIMQDMEGSFKDKFTKLEAYCNELRISNPGSDVSIELSNDALEQGVRVFRRMYVCFNAAKVGWKEGCRPFIGVDGTFLKGRAKGVLLTAVGIDANDSLYPLAFGLTQKENSVQWCWFLEWLRSSLDLDSGAMVTLMSDMQKGLAYAVTEVLPHAEHRFCARHIYANWSKAWRGNVLKKKFFSCAWSTFQEEFIDNMKSLASLSSAAAEAATTYNKETWVRAYFTTRSKSWSVDNNISESLNYWIDEYRYLPVIKMFDGIRLKMMAKWAASENNINSWKCNYSPRCIDLFEANRELAMSCRVYFNGDHGYEVCEGQDRHKVSLISTMCTCRACDLTGIPCQHAICAMYHANIDPMTKISYYYHKDTYIASYRTKLQPVRGKQFWNIDKFLPMQPPLECTLPGRPRKKRIRTEESERRKRKGVAAQNKGQIEQVKPPQQDKLTRKGVIHRCTYCKKEGHNRTTCKEAPSSSLTHPSRPKDGSTRTTRAHIPNTKGGTTCIYKPKVVSGMGITIDDSTGSIVYNPGLTSQVIIQEGNAQEYMTNYADPEKNFPIPNEKQLRKLKSACSTSTVQEGSRHIQFNPQPCLKWKGKPCITTSQLLAQRQIMISKTKATSKTT